MKIIACDDEKHALSNMERAIKEACPGSVLRCYSDPTDAFNDIKNDGFMPDIAFLDIEMPGMNGVALAHRLKGINPKINVIFATGYTEYYQEAIELHASGYILKPVSGEYVDKALKNLLYPQQKNSGLVAQTFGNFEVFFDGEPVHFARAKSKELLAYLIDRRGASATRQEIIAAIFAEDDNSDHQDKYFSQIVFSLMKTLKSLNAEDVVIKHSNAYAVATDNIKCDLYD
ncbi:MAG: response regulator [Christensenellales bacterium]